MDSPEVIERVAGHAGELVLRKVAGHHEVIANGTFLMDTRNGESERLLVDAAADRMPAGGAMLLGGLGVGYSLRRALDHARVGEVIVVEREPTVVSWNRGPLRAYHGDALADARTTLVVADLLGWIATTTKRFDAICLDIDNGPEWIVDEGNAELYGEWGLGRLGALLTPGGVLAVWSAGAATAFTRRLERHFAEVTVLSVPVPRGQPDLVFLGVGWTG
ncbi:spermine/spermidine synthase [Tamaricihabitans halophyticus]|uniref:Spermine/spermidine synthase n=1 Tax=Tamaricihabitans halophyticus TaxID=1262583 RepID=A0A4R2QJC4_9PSEU|nr:spermidine synthase [Tamaricihabitans halophyticus]TCP49367.1 spermine/spermidine synthase [Tamaricihabitans halophyticus]